MKGPKYRYEIDKTSNTKVYVANVGYQSIYNGRIYRKRRKYWLWGPIIEDVVFVLTAIGREEKKRLDDKLDKIRAGLNSKWYPIFTYDISIQDPSLPDLYSGYIKSVYYKYSWMLREVVSKCIECKEFSRKTRKEIEDLKLLMHYNIINSRRNKFSRNESV